MSDVAQKARGGRPSIFTQELADEICRRLADGETLRAICRDDAMPARSTVIAWALDKDRKSFSDQYARAREMGYLDMAEELLEIADDKAGDAARDRLRVDTRKWMLSKALPKIYGDKLETTTKFADENDQPLSALEAARRIAFAFALAEANPGAEAPPPSSTKH